MGNSRIQARNRATILEAALQVFSTHGFRGTSIDQIAAEAGLSKQNVLYYYPSKDAIYAELMNGLLSVWLDPLRGMDAQGDPVEEIVAYVMRKLELARVMPRESRLFAHEILQGAPRIAETITGPLRELVDEKAAQIAGWVKAGQLAPVEGHHLIFSIWSTTQHYADFEVQVRGILGSEDDAHYADAATFLEGFYRRALTPG